MLCIKLIKTVGEWSVIAKWKLLKSFWQAKIDVKPLFSHVIVHFVIENFPLATLAYKQHSHTSNTSKFIFAL